MVVDLLSRYPEVEEPVSVTSATANIIDFDSIFDCHGFPGVTTDRLSMATIGMSCSSI